MDLTANRPRISANVRLANRIARYAEQTGTSLDGTRTDRCARVVDGQSVYQYTPIVCTFRALCSGGVTTADFVRMSNEWANTVTGLDEHDPTLTADIKSWADTHS